jgi:hypothetical protein
MIWIKIIMNINHHIALLTLLIMIKEKLIVLD